MNEDLLDSTRSSTLYLVVNYNKNNLKMNYIDIYYA